MLVEIGGYTVKVIYFFNVMPNVPGSGDEVSPEEDPSFCPKGPLWRISFAPDDPTAPVYTLAHPYAAMGTLASAFTQARQVNLTFADLSGASVGQSVGQTLTLDMDAAGHGWYMDTMPWDNSEFVPTSNPNEWVAKADSEAAGKVDMLTVLLHEYGHVLGLNHSSDSHSLMSAELKPGVRHTVSPAEMQAISDYLAKQNPSDPNAPFNPLPWSSSLLFGFTRLRREATGSGIVLPPLPGSDPNANAFTPAPIYALSAQYQEALHDGIYNGDFALLDPTHAQYGWTPRGQVSLSDGVAELSEDTRTITGLSQTFIKSAGMNTLSFTLVGADFGADGSAPNDAFEVALRDQSGHSVVGTAGLSHTDALLNIQADGTAYAGANVYVKSNAVGNAPEANSFR